MMCWDRQGVEGGRPGFKLSFDSLIRHMLLLALLPDYKMSRKLTTQWLAVKQVR